MSREKHEIIPLGGEVLIYKTENCSIFEYSTAEEFSVVRKEGNREVRRTMTFYNIS